MDYLLSVALGVFVSLLCHSVDIPEKKVSNTVQSCEGNGGLKYLNISVVNTVTAKCNNGASFSDVKG